MDPITALVVAGTLANLGANYAADREEERARKYQDDALKENKETQERNAKRNAILRALGGGTSAERPLKDIPGGANTAILRTLGGLGSVASSLGSIYASKPPQPLSGPGFELQKLQPRP